MTSAGRSRRIVLLLALAALALTASLALRWAARPGYLESPDADAPGSMSPVPTVEPAEVPAPREVGVHELPEPHCWTCPGSRGRLQPLDYHVDLDLLAPLGRGEANVARWLGLFSTVGPRYGEGRGGNFEAEIDGRPYRLLPAASPLLAEAEAWLTHGRCRFYPDVWPLSGLNTLVPDLVFVSTLGRSFYVRGRAAGDPQLALADHRRVVRLGRLLLQDGVTLVQDLVARRLLQLGLTGIYAAATAAGEAPTAAAAALALGDNTAILHITAERRTRLGVDLVEGAWGRGPVVRVASGSFDEVVRMARLDPELRFRSAAVLDLALVAEAGPPDLRRRARRALAELAGDPDPRFAEVVRSFLPD